jgi:hypothetical protein
MIVRVHHLLLPILLACGCASERGGAVQRYEGEVILSIDPEFTFFPCGGDPKFGWRGVASPEIYQQLALRGLAHRGDMIYAVCMGYVRHAADPAKNVGRLPYDFHVQQVLQVRPARHDDCK